ncbi:Aldehyde dehydrogenase N-terminal [Penicillium vulpinum]|uniref:Aldehyde dehydrogenase domain-containing protein n=1 Tax=Penicillium vulpinum TaxID=29845 RepID=A0A1V6RZH8_9EURO|nr:Aldehyde dehydrogenase N-terminal [Penicillium vulpinum]KAJ5951174.1 Aldehyde dehydrogenase N-terminal [Penicillium vulpinum]OQE06870.1 hypothetical protein PENVUL_c016G07505 [Penicillium vulpinum]
MDNLSMLWQLDTLTRANEYLDNSTNEPIHLQNFIENRFLGYEHTSEWIDSVSPRSGSILSKVPRSPPNVVEYAINVASRAFQEWSQTPPAKRSEILLRIASILEEKREMFAVWESIDQGKRIMRARSEVTRSIEHFRYFAKYILQYEDSAVRVNKGSGESTLSYEHRLPVGVFAIITSWNMPLCLLTSKIAPCLAFGCTGVAKPSELTSMTAFLFSEVLRRAELPTGVMNIIFGDGPDTGSNLLKSPLVRGISFTGGVNTGIQIRNDTVAEIHKRLSLELRGSSPTIVFGDVDIDEAVNVAAYAAFENSGQLSMGGSVIYIHRSIYREFMPKFVQSVRMDYRCGRELGPVVSEQHYDKIRSYLCQAESENARCETGEIPLGAPMDGFWVTPTVLSNVRNNSLLLQEEVFGPVAILCTFDTEAGIVAMCNSTPNVIGTVVLTNDLSRMRRVAEQLDAGLVWGNCWLGRELSAGYNDMKAVGTGKEGGERSRDTFTRLRTVHVPSY